MCNQFPPRGSGRRRRLPRSVSGHGARRLLRLLPALLAAGAGPPLAAQDLAALAAPREESYAELPEGFSQDVLARGLTGATAMAVADDGRVFICEQTGALRLVKDGRLVPEPVLAVAADSSWERGLIGVELDPGFAGNGHVYLLHVAAEPYPHHRLSRFTLEGDRAAPGSERVLLEGDDQRRLGGSVPAGHQGGGVRFGMDGKLYIGIGEQTAGAPAQRLDTFQGKLLRLDPDGGIPADNPFATEAAGKYRAIWARGLRNPFGLAVERRSGRIFINDVGASRWEEINEGAAGANHGWPESEGPTAEPRFRSPLHAYAEGPAQSITGGVFYEPAVPQFPAAYEGKYFFADYIYGWIRSLDPDHPRTARKFARGLAGPVDLRLAPDGSLLVLNRNVWVKDASFRPGTGSLLRISYTAGSGRPAPAITRQPQEATVAAGEDATLAVEARGAPPLSFQWRRNGRDVPGAAAAVLALPAASGEQGGRWQCVVSNAHGAVLSRPARVLVAPLREPDAGASGTGAAGAGALLPGLDFEYHEFEAPGSPVLDATSRVAAGATAAGFDLASRRRDERFGFIFRGFLEVDRGGAHAFRLAAAGRAKLFVAGEEVASIGLWGGPREAAGALGLRPGRHALRLDHAQVEGAPRLEVLWSGPGFGTEPLSPARLRRRGDGAREPGRGTEPAAAARRELVTALHAPRRAGDLPPLLSQAGVFRSLRDLEPTPGLVAYEVNSPLWSDGAAKRRWIALPGEARIQAPATGSWRFPAGTVFVKHFELAGSDSSPPRRRRLETRLLVVGEGGGDDPGFGATYRWREDESDADLLRDALEEEVHVETGHGRETRTWYYPSRDDCLACHTANAGFVLGVNARQLHRDVQPPGATAAEDQLRAWGRRGLLAEPFADADLARLPRLAAAGDAAASLEHRARSYLDANCAHCHRPGGARGEFDARFETPLAGQNLILGGLGAADLGVAGAKVVVPGSRALSMVYLRMARRRDVFNMPPLASHLADEEALAVVGAWIDGLPPATAERSPK